MPQITEWRPSFGVVVGAPVVRMGVEEREGWWWLLGKRGGINREGDDGQKDCWDGELGIQRRLTSRPIERSQIVPRRQAKPPPQFRSSSPTPSRAFPSFSGRDAGLLNCATTLLLARFPVFVLSFSQWPLHCPARRQQHSGMLR